MDANNFAYIARKKAYEMDEDCTMLLFNLSTGKPCRDYYSVAWCNTH